MPPVVFEARDVLGQQCGVGKHAIAEVARREVLLKAEVQERELVGADAGEDPALVADAVQELAGAHRLLHVGERARDHRRQFGLCGAGAAFLLVQERGDLLQHLLGLAQLEGRRDLLGLTPQRRQHVDALFVQLDAPVRQPAAVSVHQADRGERERVVRQRRHATHGVEGAALDRRHQRLRLLSGAMANRLGVAEQLGLDGRKPAMHELGGGLLAQRAQVQFQELRVEAHAFFEVAKVAAGDDHLDIAARARERLDPARDGRAARAQRRRRRPAARHFVEAIDQQQHLAARQQRATEARRHRQAAWLGQRRFQGQSCCARPAW